MLRQLTRVCVRYAERYIPDPYLYAVLLTFITVVAALIWTPSDPVKILTAWYNGLWTILAFALQMALVLTTGVALAKAPIVKRMLEKLAGLPSQQAGAAIVVFLTSAIGSWLNWGFGLVIGAIVAREIAKRLRDVDFAFLVAAAYMGFMTWASGLSSSIALVSATHGSALNIIEKQTGKVAGFNTTIFTYYNLVPVVLLVIIIPLALYFMAPGARDRKRVDPDMLIAEDKAEQEEAETESTFAALLENSWIVTLLLVAMGVAYETHLIAVGKFALDLDNFIFLALMLGLIFHWRPIRYVRAFNSGAKTVGPILLQFPLYGGIMGIMTNTGLAAVMAQSFVDFSTQRTLPFWSFISSNIISLFVPSGGGHWAVQGPFMVPAALKLHADPAMTAMGTAMGEQTANMVQPFWALPILAIARLGIRDIMGYCVIALVIGLVVYGGSLLVFA
ncbi:short-chain fatty acid transporter [Methylovirgula sp. HY1]|uniref:short-chain fatty acid transporter n=1 Tax=Methylovirgula sp. HY1 TaxID=2822761 RepID=UPI001C5BC3DF|nr:TIGR00366 family protein [Methylovirgula sp. HY1]QXX74376.1 Putative short-chain fatty acid transporter [Methylovirgula sp. HY1]